VVDRPKQVDLAALIEALVDAGVEFIVIGGAAAVLHGAPTTTLDLDIVHRRTPGNLGRLQEILVELHAVVRDPAGRDLQPTSKHLEAGGQLRLLTDLGPVDLLGTLHDGRGYDDLLANTALVGDETLQIRVLDLATLIEIKAGAGRAKDRLLLPVLLALQDEISER
jgi:predicted nucleotidyltransferase